MKSGNITCTKCGYIFYFETEMDSIRCLKCQKKFDVSSFPDKEEEVAQQTTTLGKVVDWDIDEGVLL